MDRYGDTKLMVLKEKYVSEEGRKVTRKMLGKSENPRNSLLVSLDILCSLKMKN